MLVREAIYRSRLGRPRGLLAAGRRSKLEIEVGAVMSTPFQDFIPTSEPSPDVPILNDHHEPLTIDVSEEN